MFDQQSLIADMEARAEAVGLRLYEVCTQAGIAPSTYYRWLKGSPANIANLNRIDQQLRALETAKAA